MRSIPTSPWTPIAISMMGFAARPGTAVEPTCSIAAPEPLRARRSSAAIWPNADFQEGSLPASLTRPRARPSWQAPVMRTTADDATSGQAEHRRPGRQPPQSPDPPGKADFPHDGDEILELVKFHNW